MLWLLQTDLNLPYCLMLPLKVKLMRGLFCKRFQSSLKAYYFQKLITISWMKSYRYNRQRVCSRWFMEITGFCFYHVRYWTKLANVCLFQHRKHKTCFLQNPKSVSYCAFVKTGHVISRIRLSLCQLEVTENSMKGRSIDNDARVRAREDSHKNNQDIAMCSCKFHWKPRWIRACEP